ncbi:hypothetical protein ABC347_01195 [Sphingomonas sp. 1P06PA]|uniref:hypothetical protein n=1 Tax=Sphingomonas sp. 1P06PA TaxID=554121 RepID=UPI0039A5D630
MTMSRILLALFFADPSVPPAPVTAPDCAMPRSEDEIVVCAQSGRSPFRLPLPDERGLPEIRSATAEMPNGVGALGAEALPCGMRGCAGPLDLVKVAGAVKRVAQSVVDPDD